MFGAALLAFAHVEPMLPIWGAVLVFFAPDLSFAGYLAGPQIGARIYNLTHIYGLGAAMAALAFLAGAPFWMGVGLLWLAHCGFDRMLGYGLKSEHGFQITHLGKIGKPHN